MHLKIRCDGESEKFCKIFWELNKALIKALIVGVSPVVFPTKKKNSDSFVSGKCRTYTS